ncbi:B-type lectin plumieribetin-like [Anarhichas minor]|uniref:B-type lectin plumieribetin-like n=1 Tax=Anarhichas minor TaxID=65739 RepID=UPI003F73779C
MSKNCMARNDVFRKGDSLISNNGEWKADFQDDGNFVIWKRVWASDTDGSDVVSLVMQADSNLVMYNKSQEPRWHTNSYRPEPDIRLLMTDEGKLVLTKDSEEIWNSDQNRGMK